MIKIIYWEKGKKKFNVSPSNLLTLTKLSSSRRQLVHKPLALYHYGRKRGLLILLTDYAIRTQ